MTSVPTYPANWPQVSLELRAGRALWRCECTGTCGVNHQDFPSGRCPEVQGQHGKHQRGRIYLSSAHTCDCYPLCAIKAHILVLCQSCHLRLDLTRHKAARLRTVLNPDYKAKRYLRASQALNFTDLALLDRLPKRKRNKFWFPPE
jgi:hypothetical protein